MAPIEIENRLDPTVLASRIPVLVRKMSVFPEMAAVRLFQVAIQSLLDIGSHEFLK